MSLKDTLNQAAKLAENLLEQVKSSFPEAAGIVAVDIEERMARAREAIVSGAQDIEGGVSKVVYAAAEALVAGGTMVTTPMPEAWPFPTAAAMAKKQKSDVFQLFRHVRDGYVDENGKTVIVPAGGVTFYVEVEHRVDGSHFNFATAVQEPCRNFKYKLGRNVAKGRYDAGQVISAEYDTTKSLVQNISHVLDEIFMDQLRKPEVIAQLSGVKIDIGMLMMARNMVHAYTQSLPREYPGDPK